MELVAGVDAGGTSSRAVVATVHGEIVGRGRAGPGNPLAHGPERAAAEVAAAVRQALGGHSPALVRAATLGIAGPAGTRAFGAALGVGGPVTVVGDAVTAFASGTPVPSGAVLIAGTGAIAAAIKDDQVVRTSDGLGWLLGDEGSGRWLGLRAVRVAVRNWKTPFAALIAARAGVDSADDLVYWAQALPFPAIDGLAPVVCAAARDADPHATAIVTEAAACLVRTLDDLAEPGPVVLAGGLLAAGTPVRDGVLKVLAERGREPRTSLDPAAGAAWLAARPISPLNPADLHRAMLGGVA
ncbi:N-acetylglucosamine kinase [Actinoplanes capillaceus]|uniref:N-acetylglucosamine kinase n=1 Tax=Actinoplanes campanulatus TaxID=113559 RepID=A0ABQ3WK42_9ACTN|nr:BadF/BadG/BcrA/BcrD ATPase family protein [Actinoplanes capillaceus]GID46606.1 N-acetylglucosamine kinase [Actinoplanes capillaceus]